MQLVACRMCQVKFVPEIMIATIDPPPGVSLFWLQLVSLLLIVFRLQLLVEVNL